MVRKFYYSNIFQRKVLSLYTFVFSLSIGFLIGDIVITFGNYYLYHPVFKYITVIGLSGFYIGNILGKRIYTIIRSNRWFTIMVSLIIVLIALVYIFRNYLIVKKFDVLLLLMINNHVYLPIIGMIMTIFVGVLFHYCLKIASAEFIDKNLSIITFMVLTLSGISLGISAFIVGSTMQFAGFIVVLPLTILLPLSMMLDLPYNPQPLLAKDFEDEHAASVSSALKVNLVGHYIIFSCIIILYYLGYLAIISYHGVTFIVQLVTIVLIICALLIGYSISRIKWLYNLSFTMIPLLPILFYLFLITHSLNKEINYLESILLLYPYAIVSGMVIKRIVFSIINEFDHDKRFGILEILCVHIPVFTIIVLSCISFTSLWYNVIVFFIMINMLTYPLYRTFKIKNDRSVSKILIIVYIVFTVSALISVTIYVKTSFMDDAVINRPIQGNEFGCLKHGAPFLNSRHNRIEYGSLNLQLPHSYLENLQRSIVPVLLYTNKNEKVLLIDGNRKIFKNPSISLLPSVTSLDFVPDEADDFELLQVIKKSSSSDRYSFFRNLKSIHGNKYGIIINTPNCYDQNNNRFIYSSDFYQLMKKYLFKDGIFVQVFHLTAMDAALFQNAVKRLDNVYKNHAIYVFSKTIVILSSDGDQAFVINEASLNRINAQLNSSEILKGIFANESHILSHFFGKSLHEIWNIVPRTRVFEYPLQISDNGIAYKNDLSQLYVNDTVLPLIQMQPLALSYKQSIQNNLISNDSVFILLKKAEMAEANNEFEKEARLLHALKMEADYRPFIRDYLHAIVSRKERIYLADAIALEKKKKWVHARQLYQAVIILNPGNFEANYRLALLYLTLQDIESASLYLKEAMKIKNDHPKVLYLMGLLNYSNNHTQEAIEFFNKALVKEMEGSAIYKYLGFCYERIGKLKEASESYEKALIFDPNDSDIKERLVVIKDKIEREMRKWDQSEQNTEYEAERDHELPLPVNKSAYEVRLKDEDRSLPVADQDANSGKESRK